MRLPVAINLTPARHATLLKATRWTAYVLATLLLLAFASWLALPHFVKKIAIEQIEQQLGRKADIGRVDFNPFLLKLTVSDFTLYEPDRTTTAVTVRTLILKAGASSLPRRAIVLDEGLMFDPKVHLVRTSAEGIGRYNFSDVIDRILAKPKDDSTTRFLLANLQMQGADIVFDDKVTGKSVEISALNIGAPLISNLPGDVETFVQPYASATINGAHLALKGRSKPFSDSRETALALDVDDMDLASYMAFSPVALPVAMRSGKLSTKLDLRFSRIDAKPKILLSGMVRLTDLNLVENGGAPLLTSNSLQADIKQIDLLSGAAAIDKLTIDKPEVWVALDRQNRLNWLTLAAPATPAKPGKPATPAKTPAVAAAVAATAAATAATAATANATAAGRPAAAATVAPAAAVATAAAIGATAAAVAAPAPDAAVLVAQLVIHDGKVNWSDDYNATPRMTAQLKDLDLDLQQFSTAAGAPPASIKLSAAETGGGNLQVTSKLTPATGAVGAQVELTALPLAHYQPYANKFLAAGIGGSLSIKSAIDSAAGNIKLSGLQVTLNDLKLSAKSKGTGDVGVKSITLSDASLDTATRRFQAGAFRIGGLKGDVRRDAQGNINLMQFLPPASTQAAHSTGKATAVNGTPVPASVPVSAPARVAAKPAAAAAPQWLAKVGEITVADSSIAYQDSSITPPLQLQADKLKLSVANFSSALDQPLKISLDTQLNKTGKLTLAGTTAAKFKTVDLTLQATQIPVAPLQPYFNDYVNVTLRRGFVSGAGKLSIVPPLAGQPLGIIYAGTAQLTNFNVQDKENGTDFLRWRTLGLTAIDARIGKGAPVVAIGKVALDNFYMRAILSPAGKLNLKNIMVSKDAPAGSSTTDAGTASGASGAVVPTTAHVAAPTVKSSGRVAVAPVPATAGADSSAVIRIGQITLAGGNINFTDNFVKPNYTANMTGMSGTIGSIATDKPQPAPIDIKGKIDNDAQLTIIGALNPLAHPMFLDIKASSHGIELTRMTPYAAKYAGYPIIKGKLSMDVSYKIENQLLVAQNDVRIDQLTFGDRVDSPDATKLPVMLAVALLKDRNGQINLNLPISGSLEDPQFSIGGIIGRIIINLIVKVVTSPFALLNSVFGGGGDGELGYVEFAPGSSLLTSAAQQKIGALSKALADRPALKLDIIGRVDPIADDNGLRRASLDDRIRRLKRRDERSSSPARTPAANTGNANSAPDAAGDTAAPVAPVAINDADRAKYLEAVYKDEKFDKPKNVVGFNKSIPAEDMERLILEHTEVGPEQLRQLAVQRADAVRSYLEEQGKISLERVYLVAPKLTTAGIEDKGAATRVDFSLK